MQVSSQFLFRLGGSAGLAGGLLRLVFTFVPYREATAWLEGFYALTDICLLFGLMAIYLKHADQLGGIGVSAFIISTSGIASIVGPETVMFGINFYQAGAFTLITGLLILSIQMLRNKILIWVSSLWILSFTLTIFAVGFVSPVLFTVAAISFSGAYIVSGIQLVRTTSQPFIAGTSP
ncbi:MAG: hypothetical protein AAF431_13195 [Pseudomonadota bacterium]